MDEDVGWVWQMVYKYCRAMCGKCDTKRIEVAIFKPVSLSLIGNWFGSWIKLLKITFLQFIKCCISFKKKNIRRLKSEQWIFLSGWTWTYDLFGGFSAEFNDVRFTKIIHSISKLVASWKGKKDLPEKLINVVEKLIKIGLNMFNIVMEINFAK